jgi:hypothetical protein
MRNDFMSGLLGEDVIQAAGLDNALVTVGATEGISLGVGQPLQPASTKFLNRAPFTPTMTVKRTADIVDLTEDDP